MFTKSLLAVMILLVLTAGIFIGHTVSYYPLNRCVGYDQYADSTHKDAIVNKDRIIVIISPSWETFAKATHNVTDMYYGHVQYGFMPGQGLYVYDGNLEHDFIIYYPCSW